MNLIEKYLFKSRNVYITNSENKNLLRPVAKNPDIRISFHDLKDPDLKEILFAIYENKAISERYSQRSEHFWKLLLAWYNETPVGAFWILEPSEEVFYDSVAVSEEQLLFCSVYVNREYRGKGIYNQMHNVAFEYWEENCPEREVITIVEKYNEASNRSNQKYGLKISGKNYLIKFLGKNIISVYVVNKKVKLWFLIGRKKVL